MRKTGGTARKPRTETVLHDLRLSDGVVRSVRLPAEAQDERATQLHFLDRSRGSALVVVTRSPDPNSPDGHLWWWNGRSKPVARCTCRPTTLGLDFTGVLWQGYSGSGRFWEAAPSLPVAGIHAPVLTMSSITETEESPALVVDPGGRVVTGSEILDPGVRDGRWRLLIHSGRGKAKVVEQVALGPESVSEEAFPLAWTEAGVVIRVRRTYGSPQAPMSLRLVDVRTGTVRAISTGDPRAVPIAVATDLIIKRG